MGVGYACRLLNLLLRSTLHAERDVAAERVVEEYRLLVDVADELSQVVYTEILDVDAVDEHLALLHVIVARNEVDECRLARSALSDESHGLTLLDDEVDVAQHPLLAVAERHVAELYLMLERSDVLRLQRFLDGVLRLQNLVYALH